VIALLLYTSDFTLLLYSTNLYGPAILFHRCMPQKHQLICWLGSETPANLLAELRNTS